MNKLIKHIKRLALALCLATPCVSWAADAPTITIDGTTVTINNETATLYDSSKTLTVNATWQAKGFWIPSGTGLAAGTMVKVTSIAFAVPSTGNFVDKIGLAGCVSASAVRTAGGFATAGADKVLFSFEDSECLMRVGSGSQIWYLDSTGEKVPTSTVINFTIGGNANQYIDSLGWTISQVFYTPIIEVVGEILTGSSITGAQTEIGNAGTDPLYAFGVTGWLDTDNSKTGHIVLVANNSGTYSIGVNNANSVNNSNRHSTWSKLSGSGILGTVANNKGGTYPVLEIYDTSDFTGTITTSGVSGAPNLSVVLCKADESATLSSSYNSWFNQNQSHVSSIYVSQGRTGADKVTIPVGKTWKASKLLNNGETVIDGTFDGPVVNEGSLIINGTVTGAISGSGTVVVNAGATLTSFGSQRDFTGWTVDPSVAAKIAMTTEEYGKGSVSVTGADGISSITVLAPNGTTEVGSITPDAGAGTLETGIKVSGQATWCDYEFNGDKSNSGTDTTGLTSDVNTTNYPEIFNNQMLYTYTHPWRDISYPNSWTAVVRCTVPELENAVVVMFGTYSAGAIGLIAGANPEEEMLLVSTPGSTATTSEAKHFTTLATMSVKDATTAQHVYVFTKDGTTVNVYCDGENVLENYELASATLGGGLQVGSLHGGVVNQAGTIHTGLVRFGAGEDQISSLTLAQQQNARIDCMRMFDYIVSPEQIAALSVEFPSVKLYRATVAEDANTTWGALAWTPAWDGGNTQSKVILTTEGDATVELPESITVDEVQLDLETGSTLTLVGPGSLSVTQPITIEDGTLELTGTVTLARDAAFNGSVKFTSFTKAGDGAIKLSNGATVGVDDELVVTPLGSYTCAEGTVADSVYTGEGVKLVPYASAKVSVTQNGATLYYSDLDTGVGILNDISSVSDDVRCELLNGTTLPFGYDTALYTIGYYIDGSVITKAVARISSTTYSTLADAVSAATDGGTVTLLLNSSETITLNKAITLAETGSFSGTLTGTGTLTFSAFRNNPSITFSDWTGTVVLPEFAANGTVLNKYGVTGSTVVLNGITGGWLGETSSQAMTVAPVLQLDGNVTITGFSTAWTYTFAEITGTGTLAFTPADNHPLAVNITKVGEGFTGSINNGTDKTIAIATLARAAGTSTAADTKLLTTSGNFAATALTVGGEAVDVPLVTKNDGIYVDAVASVTAGESTTRYATLAAAVDGAADGATVTLLGNVTLAARVEPNLGAGTTLTIDLGGYTLTREGTSGNGSVFDVKSGTVTIKNGTIDCTQDDAAIIATGVYAITSRSGSAVYLETLTITVDSECGACAYPFEGSTMTIRSGTYSNTTTTPYRYKSEWTGMAVNQANVATQLLFLEGGSFSQVDPKLGDDSGLTTSFLAAGMTTQLQGGVYVVVPAGFDGGDGSTTFTIANQDGITLPAGKALADAASATSGLTYAQAWVLGLLDDTTGELTTDVASKIEVKNGNVVVTLNGTPQDGYVVTLKVYEKASLSAEWPAEATQTYTLGSAAATTGFTPGSAAAGFYKVEVTISNATQVSP